MSSQESSSSTLLDISLLVTESIIPKLPFTPEEKESSKLRNFFTHRHSNNDGENSKSSINTSKRTENLQKILNLLSSTSSNEINLINTDEKYSKEWAVFIIFLGEQANGSKEWSCSENERLVSEILKVIRLRFLKKYSESNRLEGIFQEDFENSLTTRETIFCHCLKLLKMKLKPNEWKYYPAGVNAFSWILTQIKYPYLSDFVDDVLPVSLLMTDDLNVENKLQGIDCIHHCINNVNKAELLRNNWAMVVYDALQKLINDKDTAEINKLAPTLLKILSLIEENPNENCHKLTKYDKTLKKILFAMEFSGELKQNKVWLPHLIAYLETMGLASLHWVNRINSMLLNYTTCNDPEMWLAILKCVEVCIKNTWVRPSSKKFSEIILRIIFNYSIFPEVHKDNIQLEIRDKIKNCFDLLSKCEDFEETKAELEEILVSSERKKLSPKFLTELEKYNLIE